MTRLTLRLLRWAVFLAAGVFLYLRVSAGQGNYAAWRGLGEAVAGLPPWVLPLLLLLALANWGIESVKWRRLLAPVERLGPGRAFTATLAGTAVALVTPNRTGEFAGRVLFLASGNRWSGAMATMLGGIAQLVTTLAMGGATCALAWWLAAPGSVPHLGMPLAMLAAAVAVGAVVLFFRPALLRKLLLRVPFLRRMERATAVLEAYSGRELAVVLGLSMGRYAVFCGQFILLLGLLAELRWQDTLGTVPVIYLITTLVPTMLLSEIGVRGSVAVALLSPLGGAPAAVLLATIGLWAVNVALPAVAGAVIILVARIRVR